MSQATSGNSPFREAIWPHAVLHAQLGLARPLGPALDRADIAGWMTGKEIDREWLNGSHPCMPIPPKT
ncbi:hypothetical protein ABZW11_07770 [Nonomuraea sp. NPDC004580]|uniref:hypothetical protein n=1 Tax=Nonomuraea sp. NPDC004580 TaxID=3154552 RepID=UPI0033A85FAB